MLLHWLAGGTQTWDRLGSALARRGFRVAAIDAPGFGRAANRPAVDVAHTADALIDTIRQLRAGRAEADWLLGGHSMGGKFATVIARRALDGEPGLEGLRGLVLVSPSPPSPEPINERSRQQRIDAFGTVSPELEVLRRDAAQWVRDNTGKLPLPEDVQEAAVDGVLRSNPSAYRGWFLRGSQEDWSSRVGTLALPALIFTGEEETKLGEAAQRSLTLPHLPGGEVIVLEKAKHLAPLERPGVLLEHLTTFATRLGLPLRTAEQAVGTPTAALTDGEHTSPTTRAVMQARLGRALDWNYTPRLLDPADFHTLRALVEAVVPDAGFDIAASLDAQLESNPGDGWRFAVLPGDPEAWKQGLHSLDAAARRAHGVPFLALYPHQQHDLLQQASAGELGPGLLDRLHLHTGPAPFSALAMQRWFEEVRAECTRLYIGDPRTMERIGYTGFADDLGFTQIQLAQHEEFER